MCKSLVCNDVLSACASAISIDFPLKIDLPSNNQERQVYDQEIDRLCKIITGQPLNDLRLSTALQVSQRHPSDLRTFSTCRSCFATAPDVFAATGVVEMPIASRRLCAV